jgi:hypothetical protein
MLHRTHRLAALALLVALVLPSLAAAQGEIDTDEIQADKDIPAETEAQPAPPAEPVEEEYQPGPTAVPTPAPPPTPAPAPAPPPAPAPNPYAPVPAPPPPVESTPPATSNAPQPQPLDQNGNVVGSEAAVEAEEKDDEDKPFNWFTIAPEVGYLLYPAADMQMQGITFTVNQRMGFIAKVHVDLGGAGLSVDLAPLIEAEGANGFKLDASQGVSGGLGGDYVGFGGELSLLYKFHVGKFFPHLGLGFHGAYLTSDALEYGSELFGRIPLGFTAYMGESVAFVFEFGFMYGVTGIRWKFTDAMKSDLQDELVNDLGVDLSATGGELPTNKAELDAILHDPNNQDTLSSDTPSGKQAQQKMLQSIASKTLQFGDGLGFDFMIGLRFP